MNLITRFDSEFFPKMIDGQYIEEVTEIERTELLAFDYRKVHQF